MKANAVRAFAALKEAVASATQDYSIDEKACKVTFSVSRSMRTVRYTAEIRDESYILFLSHLDLRVSKAWRSSFAEYVCRVNYEDIMIGCFDYKQEDGTVLFRVTQYFDKSLLSAETVSRIIELIYREVDAHYMALSKQA